MLEDVIRRNPPMQRARAQRVTQFAGQALAAYIAAGYAEPKESAGLAALAAAELDRELTALGVSAIE